SVFRIEQRDALRARMLQLADEDERVVAGAAVGSLAVGTGDRFSDLDLTFGIADGVPIAQVLEEWTRTLGDELDAVGLADLEVGPTIYRVFLLPDALQFDLSMTPAADFRPAGPRFQLLFGETAADEPEVRRPPGGLFIPTPAGGEGIFRVGRHLFTARTRLYRAWPHLAGGALRRRGARPCPRARVSHSRARGCSGAWLRRPSPRDSCALRRHVCRVRRARCPAPGARRLGTRPPRRGCGSWLASRGGSCRSPRR